MNKTNSATAHYIESTGNKTIWLNYISAETVCRSGGRGAGEGVKKERKRKTAPKKCRSEMGIIGDISAYQRGGESPCTTVCGNRPWSKMIALFRENQSGLKMMESGGYLRWGAPPTLLIPVLIFLSGRLRPSQLIHSSERRQFSAAQQPLTTFSPLSTRGPSLLWSNGLSCTSRGSLCPFNCLEYSFINTHNPAVCIHSLSSSLSARNEHVFKHTAWREAPLASHLASENERWDFKEVWSLPPDVS